MSNDKTGGPAFPVWELNDQGKAEMTDFGMTLRDYFAAKATEEDIKAHTTRGMRFVNEAVDDHSKGHGHKKVISKTVAVETSREEAKYRYADAMLEARKS